MDQSSSNVHSYDLDLKIPFPMESNQSLKKWLIPGLGQEMFKMNLEQLILPDSKEPANTIRVMPKGLRSLVLMAKVGTI